MPVSVLIADVKYMTIEQFIETAEKGGFSIKGGADCYTKDEEYFLNPAAWKAVGKFMDERTYNYAVKNVIFVSSTAWDWQYAMKRMIEDLIWGKTLEEYIATL